jgi:hypothetical protein
MHFRLSAVQYSRGVSSIHFGPCELLTNFFFFWRLHLCPSRSQLLNPGPVDRIRRVAFNLSALKSWKLKFLVPHSHFLNNGDDQGNQKEEKGQRCGKAGPGAFKDRMRSLQNYT